MQVLAKENQVPAQERCSSTATISVTITDVNDETPSFEKTNYEAFVYENATGGTTIIQVKVNISDITLCKRLCTMPDGSKVFDGNKKNVCSCLMQIESFPFSYSFI